MSCIRSSLGYEKVSDADLLLHGKQESVSLSFWEASDLCDELRIQDTRSLAGKPFGLVPHYGKWTYYSLIRQYRARYTCQIPTMTLIIDDKKRAAWGESGFPSKFLVSCIRSSLGYEKVSDADLLLHGKQESVSLSFWEASDLCDELRIQDTRDIMALQHRPTPVSQPPPH